jgi:FkbM family methyltransferase
MPAFDFIEIGTSDFDTLIESSDDNTVGLSVDALKMYLDKLPEKKNVKKIHAGVSDREGNIDIYFVRPEQIEYYHMPTWLRGCNSVGEPHPTVLNVLNHYGIPSTVIEKETVVLKSMATLLIENDVQSIDYLKIDTEGHDCVILQNYIDFCEGRPELFAKKIRFETNILSSRVKQQEVIDRLLLNGYTLVSFDEDTVLTRQA